MVHNVENRFDDLRSTECWVAQIGLNDLLQYENLPQQELIPVRFDQTHCVNKFELVLYELAILLEH